ncbi:MAG: hypothetical protein ACFE9L_08665 [Candidatus Hodarchaeota archaeon]
MVDFEIGVREKAGRNLVVLAFIPIVTLIWLIVFIVIYEYAINIVRITGKWEYWFLTTIIFAVISLLELVAILYIRFK